MRLDDLVQENYDRMNANDHRIWRYICQHKTECQKMSLHQLADACEVSQTTILRFLHQIGMDGYNDFKAFLKWDSLNQPVFDQRGIEQTSYNLIRTIHSIQQADCSRLFSQIDQAGRLYAYGNGVIPKAVAKAFKDYLILTEKLLHVIEGAEERAMAMCQMQQGDVVFLLSISGDDPVMNDFAKALRGRGVFLAAICQDGASDLSKLCHFHLSFFTQKMDIGYPGPNHYGSAGMLSIAEMLVLKYIAYQYYKNP